MKKLYIICFLILFLVGCELNKEVANKEQQNVEKTTEKKEEQIVEIDNEYFPFYEGHVIHLQSKEGFYNYKIEFIKLKGNAMLAKGIKNDTLNFYRIYRKDNEGINIYYEISEEQEGFSDFQMLIHNEEYNKIFELNNNQEFFLLKYPFEKNNHWGNGTIVKLNEEITIKNEEIKTMVVEFENGDKYYYNKEKGLVRYITFSVRDKQIILE